MTKLARGPRGRRVVINADDFGASRPINMAILQAFGEGLISSATIMANMPGFEEACELAHRHGLLGRIGLHLNLTAGRPLTSAIAVCGRFCDAEGCWRPRRRVLSLNREEACALEQEISAQIGACKGKGITPTHLDSHHHMHTEWGVSAVVIRSAQSHGIPGVRLAINCGSGRRGTSLLHRSLARGYWSLHNLRLRRHGLARTRYFGGVQDTLRVVQQTTAALEIMVHPKLNHDGQLVDFDGHDLKLRIQALCIPAGVMCSYADLR
jgi:predicted glycoside hydrolase/deacetylase ChbG (UPF0249 family)